MRLSKEATAFTLRIFCTVFLYRVVRTFLFLSLKTKKNIYRSSHWRCSIRKVFLKISQNLQKNTFVRVSYLIKFQASACNFILKKRLWHRCFTVNFAKFLRTPFLQNTSGRLLLHLDFQLWFGMKSNLIIPWFFDQL